MVECHARWDRSSSSTCGTWAKGHGPGGPGGTRGKHAVGVGERVGVVGAPQEAAAPMPPASPSSHGSAMLCPGQSWDLRCAPSAKRLPTGPVPNSNIGPPTSSYTTCKRYRR